MIVRDKHNAIVGKDVHQSFADQFGIGVSEWLVGDFPYLGVGATQGFANGVKFRAPTGNHRDRRRGSVDLFGDDLFPVALQHLRALAERGHEVVHPLDLRSGIADRTRIYTEVGRTEGWNLYPRHLPDTSHPDVTRLIDAGLNREHTGEIDFVHLLVAAFDLAAHLQLAAV